MGLLNSNVAPYLKPNRLADVIAALQVMGKDPRAEHPISRWSRKLSADTSGESIDYWTNVFKDHGEFFLVYRLPDGNEAKAVLRSRYIDQNYDVNLGRTLTFAEVSSLSDTEKWKLSYTPLQPIEITELTKTAVELHNRTIAANSDRRWWIPIIGSSIPAIIALLGVYIGLAGSDKGKAAPTVMVVTHDTYQQHQHERRNNLAKRRKDIRTSNR
jgi:hypothetical protein